MFPQRGSELLLRILQGNGPPEMSPPNRVFEEEEILMPLLGSDTKGRACLWHISKKTLIAGAWEVLCNV